MRGSRDFAEVEEYRSFLGRLFAQLNSGRRARLAEEMELLRPLPDRRLESAKRVRVRVNSGSLIKVERNSYSVNSRLIGEIVQALGDDTAFQPANGEAASGSGLRPPPPAASPQKEVNVVSS